jgi:predicted HTH transcriptional regulator
LFLGTNAAITDHFSDFRVDYLEIPATNYADAERANQKRGMIEEDAGQKTEKTDKKTTRKQLENNQKTTRKQPEDIKNLILEIIRANAQISRSEMIKQLQITEGSLRHHLEQLKNAGIICREGPDKGGKWAIIDKEKQ